MTKQLSKMGLYENEVVTKHEFDMINITNEVKKAVADSGIKNGMVAVITGV